jgi:hypothetical protein
MLSLGEKFKKGPTMRLIYFVAAVLICCSTALADLLMEIINWGVQREVQFISAGMGFDVAGVPSKVKSADITSRPMSAW